MSLRIAKSLSTATTAHDTAGEHEQRIATANGNPSTARPEESHPMSRHPKSKGPRAKAHEHQPKARQRMTLTTTSPRTARVRRSPTQRRAARRSGVRARPVARASFQARPSPPGWRQRGRAGNHAPLPPCTRAGWLEGPGAPPRRSFTMARVLHLGHRTSLLGS
jgi:hypothetical protein